MINAAKRQQGFTIIELMIATTVFSVVLLLCTTGLLRIGRAYTQGVVVSRTQEATRNTIDTIAQTIQLTPKEVTTLRGPGPTGNTAAYCVGNQQFSFILNQKLVTGAPSGSETRHALLAHSAATGGCPAGTDPSSSVASINTATAAGKELLGVNMQLAKLEIENLTQNRVRITVKVIHGDDDLFVDPNTPNAVCRLNSGTQFCATSELSTIVQRRVQ